MINNRDCFFYKKSDFINRLQDLSPDSVCYIADTQQIYTHGRYFECNVTQDIVEQLIQNHGYLTPADLPVLTGGASPTPDEYVTGVSVGGHNINVQKGKLSEINVGSASKLETPRKIELSGDLSGSTMFDGSQDVNIETIVHNSTTADRLTTPRTISLSSQATGQVSFDGSGNVDIPVTVNELDSKNANNRDLNSLVTLNGYGGNLFYGIGGNTSTNKPSGIDWFGLLTFKSASGNYTTQILGSNNRLYSRSNADTSLGSWNTVAYLTDNVASATKLQNTRTFTISDGTNSGTASNFDGTGNVTLRLPRTINADIVGNVTGDIVGDITGDLHGNADTATKLQTGRNINGTLFDGTRNITTAQWGTARNLTIGNSTKSVNGSANVSWTLSEIGAVNKAGDTMTGALNMQAGITLLEADGESTHLHGIFAANDWWDIAGYATTTDGGYLDIRTGDNGNEPIYISQIGSSGNAVHRATILDGSGNTQFPGTVTAPTFSGALSGNASTASKLATARTISLTGDASGSASFDGSANISIPVTIANDSHTHATSASSNATTNLTITAGGTTATVADLYATYADQLRTARTISLTGDVTGSTSFNGTGNVSIAATVANNSHTHTFANITDKPISGAWSQDNNNNITTAQFLDLLEDAGAFKYGWFHAKGLWSYANTSNITDTGYGTLDLAGCAITVWGTSRTKCTILVIPPLNSSVSPSVELGTIYIYVNNGESYSSGWRKIARFEDIDWNNITNKPSSFTPSSHTHPLSQISNLNGGWDSLLVNAPSAYLTRWPSISEVTGKQNFILKLNGGTTEGTNQFTYNGTVAKSVNITPSGIGAAAASHSHPLSGISDLNANWDAILKAAPSVYVTRHPTISEVTNKQNLVIKLNGGTTEGTNQFTYNGTTAKTLNITPSSIGAAASSHTHTISQISGLQAELNSKLESVSLADLGVTATAAEINKLDGLATTAAELGYVHGVTSNIQTQLNSKANASALSAYALKDGSNASGTWPISISGNAASATTASKLGSYTANKYMLSLDKSGADFNTITESGAYRFGASNTNGPGYNYGQLLVLHGGGDTIAQIAVDYSASMVRVRAGNPTDVGGTGTWRSWNTLLDTSNYTSYTVTKTGGGASGTWNINISGTAAKANSVAWNNVSGKPSSYTPSSHTHNISQITGRGTLTFTGAATGTYNGSGNLTINIPEGGGEADSVAWNNITGKPSTFTPAAHTHGTDDITALTGYREGSATTTLSASMTLNAALASLQNQVQAKAALTHTHTASQVSGLADVATSGDYNDLSNKPTIPSLSGYATQTWVNGQIDAITPASIGAAASNHSHTWNSITNKPSWIGSSKPSYSWNEISGKPSSFTPSSHTHPISQITNRGTLTFTGAATGSYDGSGNLTINIPSGGMSSVSWSDISGKPSTFTPSAHTHSASDITSGTLALARIPTGTTSTTVALGNHTHSEYSTTDTKNTAGSTNTSSKLFLIGATSQAANPITYSNSSVYTINSELHASKMYATDGFYETSDARLKTFGEDIKALEVVSELPTKYFTWKSDESKTEHIGTSAQEIQKLYPDLVTENEDGVLSVDYARLSIIALAAIKELKAQIDELKSKIN